MQILAGGWMGGVEEEAFVEMALVRTNDEGSAFFPLPLFDRYHKTHVDPRGGGGAQTEADETN